MSELKISEAGTVQFPMVKHAAEIGWTPLTPEVAKQKRGGEAGMLLRDELEAKLARFNPWMSADAIRQVIETLEAIPPTVEGNREMLAWLRGERQWYDEDEKRHRRVQLVDFEHADANVFHVTWEWALKPPARKGNRADVMFVVNGVPVCIVEHKNPKDGDAIERGDQAAAPLREGNAGADRRAAALQRHASARLLVWRDLERHPPLHGALEADARRGLQLRGAGVLRAHRLPAHASALDSVLCRGQRDARNRCCASTSAAPSTRSSRAARTRRKTRGLVWHTQGSGKTFTLLTAARADPRAEGALQERDRDPRRRSHRA